MQVYSYIVNVTALYKSTVTSSTLQHCTHLQLHHQRYSIVQIYSYIVNVTALHKSTVTLSVNRCSRSINTTCVPSHHPYSDRCHVTDCCMYRPPSWYCLWYQIERLMFIASQEAQIHSIKRKQPPSFVLLLTSATYLSCTSLSCTARWPNS